MIKLGDTNLICSYIQMKLQDYYLDFRPTNKGVYDIYTHSYMLRYLEDNSLGYLKTMINSNSGKALSDYYFDYYIDSETGLEIKKFVSVKDKASQASVATINVDDLAITSASTTSSVAVINRSIEDYLFYRQDTGNFDIVLEGDNIFTDVPNSDTLYYYVEAKPSDDTLKDLDINNLFFYDDLGIHKVRISGYAYEIADGYTYSVSDVASTPYTNSSTDGVLTINNLAIENTITIDWTNSELIPCTTFVTLIPDDILTDETKVYLKIDDGVPSSISLQESYFDVGDGTVKITIPEGQFLKPTTLDIWTYEFSYDGGVSWTESILVDSVSTELEVTFSDLDIAKYTFVARYSNTNPSYSYMSNSIVISTNSNKLIIVPIYYNGEVKVEGVDDSYSVAMSDLTGTQIDTYGYILKYYNNVMYDNASLYATTPESDDTRMFKIIDGSGDNSYAYSLYNTENEPDPLEISFRYAEEARAYTNVVEEVFLGNAEMYIIIQVPDTLDNVTILNYMSDLIVPYEDYISAFNVIHTRAIAYLIDRAITETSNSNDIYYVQQLLATKGFSLDYNKGIYDDSMKSFIIETYTLDAEIDVEDRVSYNLGYVDPIIEGKLTEV